MKLKVIITGATGMVGEGVLHECLMSGEVEEVLTVTRTPIWMEHPKLKKIIISDFFKFSEIENQVVGYNACFFCLGVSSVGMKEEDFSRISYDLTMAVAHTLVKVNPELTFCYISGAYTDSTEKGRSMWARVKGRTENDLLKLFKNAYMFRPGYMRPTKGMKHTLPYYKYIDWMYPVLRLAFSNFVTTLSELGLAMIHTTSKGYSKRILEVKDIVSMSKP